MTPKTELNTLLGLFRYNSPGKQDSRTHERNEGAFHWNQFTPSDIKLTF